MAILQRRRGRLVDARDRLRDFFDMIYHRYHRREMVPPDPLQCLYAYEDPVEREVAALLAASLAVGRAQSIVHQVSAVLSQMGPKPASFLKQADAEEVQRVCRGFRYRFFAEDELRAFLEGVRAILRLCGSLESAMAQCLTRSQGDVLRALDLFAGMLEGGVVGDGRRKNRLVASPSSGSACKRWHLFLRWMVRCDAVDPGGWSCLRPRDLIVPVDTHMFAVARTCNLTRRRHCDLKTALEITEGFRRLCPDDPVRYDFSLTRMAMKGKEFLDLWRQSQTSEKGAEP